MRNTLPVARPMVGSVVDNATAPQSSGARRRPLKITFQPGNHRSAYLTERTAPTVEGCGEFIARTRAL